MKLIFKENACHFFCRYLADSDDEDDASDKFFGDIQSRRREERSKVTSTDSGYGDVAPVTFGTPPPDHVPLPQIYHTRPQDY